MKKKNRATARISNLCEIGWATPGIVRWARQMTRWRYVLAMVGPAVTQAPRSCGMQRQSGRSHRRTELPP